MHVTLLEELDNRLGNYRPLSFWALTHTSNEAARSPSTYANVIAQFNVENSGRYAARDGQTWCNIFVWDVTRAMMCELPHWVDERNEPCGLSAKGKRELTANATIALLLERDRWGWRQATPPEAKANALAGRPTVVGWQNNAGPGHIAMVRPPEASDIVLRIAQAGSKNYENAHLIKGFGARTPLHFFVHT